MKTTHLKQSWMRPTVLLVASSMLVPTLAGCGGGGGGTSGASAPPVDDTRGGTVMPSGQAAMRPTMSTGKKRMIALAGAAALYYLYKKHKSAQAAGPEGQYYLSKNGRVYYRDAQHRAHWVTPPKAPIMVPEEQAQEYSQYKGYSGNMSGGRDLTGLGTDETPAGVPAPAY